MLPHFHRLLNQINLSKQLLLRLLATLMISLIVVLGISLILFDASLKQTGDAQISSTLNFFRARMNELDEGWASDAMVLKSRIEYSNLLENKTLRHAALQSFLTVQGEQRVFSHVIILDRNGKLLVHAGKEKEDLVDYLPIDRHKSIFWLYESAEKQLYRGIRYPIWLGTEGQGYLVALMLIEHATLYAAASNQIDLFAFWGDEALASSLGSGGLKDSRLLSGNTGWNVEVGRVEQRVLHWGSEDSGAALLVRQKIQSPFSSQTIWVSAVSIVAGLMLVVWLVLGGWLRGTVKRVEKLELATNKFQNLGSVTDVNELFISESERIDEISKLSAALQQLMLEVKSKESQLGKLNDNLESMVAERTLELENSNEKLQDAIDALFSTQNELIQSGKMASLGSLVAGISHEVNTPLGISVTSASSLQDQVRQLHRDFDLGTMKRSDLEQYMTHAEEASDILLRNLSRASDLIRSFKSVAVDQTSDEQRVINVRNYIDEIILSLHPNLKRTLIQVVNECDADIKINTFPGAIYQIISNFVMNSLVHAYENGQTGCIKIAARLVGRDIALEYSDDGKGIAEKDIEHVFDPFFTTKRGQGGSGLGLNIVYNLVHTTLKGNILIESKLGSGTTFKVKFPVEVANA